MPVEIFFEDYTVGHETTERADMNAKIERMRWIGDTYNVIIGSERGNDFSSEVITFSHGMTSYVMDWMDDDLRKNEDSEYYLGKYGAVTGVPSKYVKEVPLKPKHKKIYYDMKYSLPLFELVYNDSVFSSYHWEMGSLKVPEENVNNMLKEVLYSIPPLYHLDREYWNKYREVISNHVKVWSELHEITAPLEMTNFEILDENRLVQRTEFSGKVSVTANFKDTEYNYNGKIIPAKSASILSLIHI